MSNVEKVLCENAPNAFETFVQLRTHLTLEDFLNRLEKQERETYQLVGIFQDEKYVAVAGFRYAHNMAWGKFLYCDDLVVHTNYRKKGFGNQLMKYLYKEAQNNGCNHFHLDSGVQRFDAHRLYLTNGMNITCHHFGKEC